ncbi:MAG: class I SAM-dependent methyltransferase [Gammaproteobacteria bacterium]|nr:class I SAM-dependent methyltransferase [Gammaproteobacteria bacterium]
MTLLKTSLGTCEVQRYPKVRDQTLLPFDHADKMLLNFFANESILSHEKLTHTFIVNDEFGALTCALSSNCSVTHWTDSLLSQIATKKNLSLNFVESSVEFLNSTDEFINSKNPLPSRRPDLILMRLPKNLNHFKHQLCILSECFPEIPIWFGIMQKFITPQVKKVIEKYCINIDAGRSEKKARVIKAVFPATQNTVKTDILEHAESYTVTQQGTRPFKIVSLPNVFSANSLDIGSRFLLDNFPDLSSYKSIADFGCGNGLLSIFAGLVNPNITVTGYDESYHAIVSAKKSAELNHLNNIEFKISNCANDAPDQSHDGVLCNPPFHQQRRVTTDTAHYMFEQAFRVLKNQGTIWVIANRHLNYHHALQKIFGNAMLLASNPRFVILCSTKTEEVL